MKSITTISTVALAVVALLALGIPTFAGETCNDSCPVAEKVTSLVAGWKAEMTSMKAMPEATRTEVSKRLSATKDQCPVGSRLGSTLTAVQSALATTVALSNSLCTDDCPMQNGTLAASDPEAYRKGKALLERRARAFEGLHQLATYTATACNGCCAEAVPTSIAKAGEDCESPCATGQAACPIRLASKIGELKADWTIARREAANLAQADRQAIFTSIASIGEHTKVVELVPASVIALTEGFDALHALDTEMKAWVAATPALANIPAEARMTHRMQGALLEEVRGLLHDVTDTMHMMRSESGASQSTASARR